MSTIFKTSALPYIDNKLNWIIPATVLLPNQTSPKLSYREWLSLLVLSTENYEDRREIINLLGSRTTRWRILKALIEKGYLNE